jgi:hypothetical protein
MKNSTAAVGTFDPHVLSCPASSPWVRIWLCCALPLGRLREGRFVRTEMTAAEYHLVGDIPTVRRLCLCVTAGVPHVILGSGSSVVNRQSMVVSKVGLI